MAEPISDEQMKLQLNVHLAEFQARMTRINTFMTMQFTPVAPWIAFVAFIAVATDDLDRVVVVWGTVLVTQVAVFIYNFSLHEVYFLARHIETETKPRIALLLDLEMNSFWTGQKRFKEHGKGAPVWIGDIIPSTFSVAAFAAGLYWMEWLMRPWSNSLAMLLSLLLMCANVSQARGIVQLWGELERASESSLQSSVKRLARER